MKFAAPILLLAALQHSTTSATSLHSVSSKASLGAESQQAVNDLYTFSEQDNIKAEIEEAQIYMQKKRSEEAEEMKK